jgi:hypothetical protein
MITRDGWPYPESFREWATIVFLKWPTIPFRLIRLWWKHRKALTAGRKAFRIVQQQDDALQRQQDDALAVIQNPDAYL